MSARSFRRPDPVEVELRPRPRGGARRLATLSEPDARAWHDLAGRVAAAIEPRLGPHVVANRVRPGGSPWRLEGLEASLRRLRIRARGLAGGQTGPRIFLATDVEDFYPSVTPVALARALASLDVDPEAVATAAAMLEGWASSGYRGVPIGPPGSAVMANALLAPIDASVGQPFIRWADDYLVAAPTERRAAEVLERMDSGLASLGLRRSQPKTRIGVPAGWLGSALGSSGISASRDRGA